VATEVATTAASTSTNRNVLEHERSENPYYWPVAHLQKTLTQSIGNNNIDLERVSTHVTTTLEDVKRNSRSFVENLSSSIPSIEGGNVLLGSAVGDRAKLAPLRNVQSKSNALEPQKKTRKTKGHRRSAHRSASGSQESTSSGSPKTPNATNGANRFIHSPQAVLPHVRRVMSDTSIETFFRDAREKVTSSIEKQGSLENLLSLSTPVNTASTTIKNQLQTTSTLVHSRSTQALNAAQQTLNNFQNNVNMLQMSLHQSFSEGKAVVELRYKRLQALGEPGSPFSSKERLADIISADGGNDDNQGPFQKQAMLRKKSIASYSKTPSENSKESVSSSLKDDGRQITIVTTASLPWMTGTSVNPLLRAAYLAKDGAKSVNLMVPWLAKSDQQRIFPNGVTFDSPEEQEAWVKNWLKKRTGFDPDFKLTFYPGRYAPEKCSILPVGDPTRYVPDSAADVAILEEPEHLTWYHHGKRWTDKFSHVVGVVHTNYLDYARREDGGSSKELLLKHINNWVTRIHCHKVVKLSDAVQDLPRQTTEFVHGVADSFLSVGEKKAQVKTDGMPRFSKGAYFLGKCVWAKGYTELIDLLSQNKEKLGNNVMVDCYGTGEDLQDVKLEAQKRELKLEFLGARDHLDESIHDYQVFVNPSMSDVVATTSAEALAMGKWLVCADHPSNAFFSQFKNCLIYKTPDEFVDHMKYALSHEPAPMTKEDRERLTWEAATERFLNVTELTGKDLSPGILTSTVDTAAWLTHNSLCGVEPLRAAAGAGKNTRDNPECLIAFQPDQSGGGMFDRR
jgi:digalactosyldiacylglycerol synthase